MVIFDFPLILRANLAHFVRNIFLASTFFLGWIFKGLAGLFLKVWLISDFAKSKKTFFLGPDLKKNTGRGSVWGPASGPSRGSPVQSPVARAVQFDCAHQRRGAGR